MESGNVRAINVFVDVDDTLIRNYGTKRIPILAAIRHIKALKSQGANLYCWSSGGAEYAQASAQELGIEQCFTCFLPKPNVLLDDQNMTEWKYFQWVHPLSCSNLTLDDYRRDLFHVLDNVNDD